MKKSGTTKGAKGAKGAKDVSRGGAEGAEEIAPIGGSFKEQARRAWARELDKLQTRAAIIHKQVEAIWRKARHSRDLDTERACVPVFQEIIKFRNGLFNMEGGK